MAEKTVYIIDIDDRAKAKLQGIQKEAKKTDGSFSTMGSTLSGLAGGAVVGAMVAIGKGIYDITAQAEQTRISMEVMLGDSGKASKMIGEIRSFAAATPFETADLEDAAKMMLGYGISAEKIMPNIKMLGDVASGNTEKFKSLTYAFSQIQASGKLAGQDLMQLINAGFNPLKIIADKTGISMGVLKKKMSDGAISADMVSAAFEIATSKGGLFYKMNETQALTLGGKMSTIIDTVKLMGLSMGESSMGGMHSFLDTMQKIVDTLSKANYEPFMDAITAIGNSLGIVGTAIESVFTPIANIFNFFGGEGLDKLDMFFKMVATGATLAFAPMRLLADLVQTIYEAFAGLVTLDFNRMWDGVRGKNVGKGIGNDFADIWTNDTTKNIKAGTGSGNTALFGGMQQDKRFTEKQFGEGFTPITKAQSDLFAQLNNKTGKAGKAGKGESAGGISLNESRNGATNINITIDTFQKNDFTNSDNKYAGSDIDNFMNRMAIGLQKVLLDSQQLATN